MNYAAEQHMRESILNSTGFKNKTYTLTNSRGQITYNVNLVNHQYNVVSIGTVNNNDGLLLARAQVESRADQFPENFPEPSG